MRPPEMNPGQGRTGAGVKPNLSLRIDSAVVDLDEMPRGGPVHISVVVREVMADLARQREKGGGHE